MKTLFLYTPARGTNGGQNGLHFWNMIMPVGFIALADILHRAGHSVEVVHEGIETALDGKFAIEAAVRDLVPDLVAISLHFHHQMASVERAVRKVKSAAPDARIALGGFTASFFHREIMERWRHVDFVIRGDGEAPLYQLARLVAGHGSPTDIPNLSHRRDGAVVHNEFSYCADKTVMDRLTFTNLKLLRHADFYGGAMMWSKRKGLAPYLDNRYFYLCAGRGCSVNCAYCAGSASSQKIISKRARPVMRGAGQLAADVKSLLNNGIDRFYLCFDPPGKGPSPYPDFMALLRIQNVSASMIFESYNALPSRDFIHDFSRTFTPRHSAIAFSPATASEEARKFYNGSYYTNKRLEEKLALCARLGVNTVLYFTFFPDETMAGLKQSCDWARHMSSEYGSEILFMPIEIEPGAPWHMHPEKYGVALTCRTFDDFLARSRNRDFTKFPGDPGYKFPRYKNRIDFITSKGLAPQGYEHN